jgi:hypothetical protein
MMQAMMLMAVKPKQIEYPVTKYGASVAMKAKVAMIPPMLPKPIWSQLALSRAICLLHCTYLPGAPNSSSMMSS